MRTRRTHQAGFTLVEMLTVIAIIAVLAAIIVPVYNSVKEKAARAACAANLQQIGLAVNLYKNDKKRYPASLYEMYKGGYLDSKKLVGCPDDEVNPESLNMYQDTAGRRALKQSSYDVVDGGAVWNYYGYDTNGYDSSTAQNPTDAKRKQLENRNCPGTTIITHCIFHRAVAATPGRDDIDIAIRVDGTKEDSLRPLGYDWTTQP